MNKDFSSRNQLIINLIASFVAFIVGMGINFFLTPYIIKSLGTAAYGFVGLSANIIDYTTLLTIALNSMAGRFITISYTQGKIQEANKYFSSVFYTNLILAGVIVVVMGGCVLYLEKIFEIPKELIIEVKILFSILALSSIIGLLANIFAIATFVKNRLDLSSVRQIIGKIIQATTILILFGCFVPHLWYIAIAGLLFTLYTSYTNYRYTLALTPELKLSRKCYEWKKVKDLLSSGAWNIFNKLGTIFSQGFDLVLTNWFIGSTAMGFFSISKQVPYIIIVLCGSLSNVFAPTLTQLFANNDKERMGYEINKGIRIIGFIVTIPLAFLYVFGADFYSLWVPSEDSYQLHILSILISLELSLSLPLEVVWNIFTVTNRLKVSSIFLFCNHVLTFLIVLGGMYLFDDPIEKLLILASTRAILGIVRSLTFLPIYGAHCVGLPKLIFYPAIFKSIVAAIITYTILYMIRLFFIVDSWFILLLVAAITTLITIVVNYVIVLTKGDRAFISGKFLEVFVRH